MHFNLTFTNWFQDGDDLKNFNVIFTNWFQDGDDEKRRGCNAQSGQWCNRIAPLVALTIIITPAHLLLAVKTSPKIDLWERFRI